MTLDDVIFFASKNQGRKLLTFGGHAKFSVEILDKSKVLKFVLEKGSPKHVSFAKLTQHLAIFNTTPSIRTPEYLKSTRGGAASYELGLFQQIKENQEHPANIESTLAEDVNAIWSREHVDPTTKKVLVDARLGQGKFRSSVLEKWENRCAVTGSSTVEAIRASHIKPWRDSTDSERLDPANGLPLVASLDALFDAGLISFEDSGQMLISPKLSFEEQKVFGVVGKSLRKRPSPETVIYLKHHRKYHQYTLL